MDNVNLKTEPIGLPTLLTAALIATWNVIVIVASVSADLAAGINIVIGAWVAVLAWWMRGRVSPVE